MSIFFRRLDPNLETPTRTLPGDAGVDLIARVPFDLKPGARAPIPTGIAIVVPQGFAGLIVPRSGLAVHAGLTVLNSPGVIDSGYRGELTVVLCNLGSEPYAGRRGDRIAQLLVMPVMSGDWVEEPELPYSERGDRGLGHSGR